MGSCLCALRGLAPVRPIHPLEPRAAVSYVGYPGDDGPLAAAFSPEVVQAGVLMITSGFILINLLVDISYGYLDPRVRYT